MNFLLLALVAVGEAAPCNSTDAPAPFALFSCASVCQYDSSGAYDTIECTPGAAGTAAVEFYAASGYSAGSHDHSFLGFDGAGTRFCCAYDEVNEVGQISVWGGDGDDTLYLSNAAGTISLTDPGGTEQFDLLVSGGEGDDVIETSWSPSVDEMLVEAGPGDDSITCHINSTANGSEGNDDIIGSDAFIGNTGADFLYGGDTLFGESSGNDGISAGGGADYVDGHASTDDVCGDAASDDLLGGAAGDRIRGGTGTDTADGGTGSDDCVAETEISCEEVTVLPPNTCP